MTGIIRRFVTDERGATAVEYGLIVALVSLAAGGVVMQLGDIVQLIYEYILGNVEEAATP